MEYGLKKGNVTLVDYTENWKSRFTAEKNQILSIIGNLNVKVYHIGSTAIPGIKAKPIVDVLLVFKNESDILIAKHKLEVEGYITSKFQPNGHFLVKNEKNMISTAYIHMLHEKDDWERYLIIRDYLILHPDVAKEYEQLKIKSAAKYGSDRISYTATKNDLIESIIKKARD